LAADYISHTSFGMTVLERKQASRLTSGLTSAI